MRGQRGTLRDTEGVGQDMSMPLKLFLVSGSLFSATSAQITASIRVFFSEKANFNDNGGFVVGTDKHFLWGYKRSLLTGYEKN